MDELKTEQTRLGDGAKISVLGSARGWSNGSLDWKMVPCESRSRVKIKDSDCCMRKLAISLSHVARGERFDARKLLKVAHLTHLVG